MAFLNPWSICNKTTAIHDFLQSNDLDLLAVAESWLQSSENEPQRFNQHEMLPSNYQMVYIPRPDGRKGGGIAVLFKKFITVRVIDYSKYRSCQFEYLVCAVNINKLVLKLMVVYRPNPTAANNLNVSLFWKQFEKLLSRYALCTEELIITGDLNFYLEDANNNNTQLLHSVLDEYGLDQKIQQPTHVAGHTLDVLIVRSESSLLKSIQVIDPVLFNECGKVIKDHFAIHWSLDVIKPKPTVKEIEYRELNKIDYTKLNKCLLDSDLSRVSHDDGRSVTELVELYDGVLRSVLDKVAPAKRRTVIIRENTLWYTDKITASKRLRCQAVRKFMHTKSGNDRELYRKQCRETNCLLRKVKREFYSSQIISAGRDQKTIFSLSSAWMGSNKNVLPSSDCQQTLANDISQFFTEKARKIHKTLKDTLDPTNPYIPVKSEIDPTPSELLYAFDLVTVSETKEIVMSLASKHCELDPAPTFIVKNLIDILAPAMSTIINKSLSLGVVPTSMKRALVKPLLKDSSLDPEEISNYRPVSNLSFLSKVLEKVVNKRLDAHLENNVLLSDSQSAYRKHHSTETLLIKVQNDILESLDMSMLQF